MPLRALNHASDLICQQTGEDRAVPAVYLPGVHGDWTAQAAARPGLSGSLRLIEAAYPRTSEWQLADFSRSLAEMLDRLGLESVHLIGDSFGSLVAWRFGLDWPQRVRSVVLVGGFSRPPRFRVAAAARWALHVTPTSFLEKGIDTYVLYKRQKGEARHASQAALPPYPATRTHRGRRATVNRMAIIQRTDLREELSKVDFPVRYVGGAADLIVPVRREIATLRRRLGERCQFQSHIIPAAPHTIIASHPHDTAEYIVESITQIERSGA